jgi:hypothetical protein
MKHFIVTRFNYPKNYPNREQRLALFFTFTLPSIKAQTNKNFEWILLCDEPPVAVQGITYLPPGRYAGAHKEELKGEYIDYIREATKDEDLVLMTRFDNDDMFMPTFVDDIQKAATKPGLYEYKGFRLDLRDGKFYKDKRHTPTITSPFITLAEPAKNLKTVYYCSHSKMWQHFPLTILERRNWVQVIHDTNWLLNQGNIPASGILTQEIPPLVMKCMGDWYDG